MAHRREVENTKNRNSRTSSKDLQKEEEVIETVKHIKGNKGVTMGDPLDHATGIEKRELLLQVSGNPNPFDMKMLRRGPGTKENPTEIPSAFDCRIMGCICHHDATTIQYQWIYKGTPTRCECGYWFKLVHKTPV
ncbi:hypothetical protein RN001_003082 [Aquatica leii]|uniref:Cytochrome c oxidase subunit Vb n=1 Tax=Aquatica leii TaxID=1421715 RepID=A0AAN7PN72_9COLE|nr:hypothetical protein RN001_003082 [Aquatica leii]